MKLRIWGVIGVIAVYFWNPWSIASKASNAAYTVLQTAGHGRTSPPNSLKAAMSNVTSDFDQLASLVQGFFERLPDNSTELMFREYLKSRASSSHKDFERFLDWLLSIYNVMWPFVVMSLIMKLSSSGPSRDIDPHEEQQAELLRREALKRQQSRYGLRERHFSGSDLHASNPNLLVTSVSEGNLSTASQ